MLNLLTLGYCKHEVLREGLEHAANTMVMENKHYYMWHHYPLDADNNKREHMKLVDEYKLINLNPPDENIGSHMAQNWCQEQIKLTDDQCQTCFDPDSRPVTKGWDEALERVTADPSIGWASLIGPWTDAELSGHKYETKMINGIRCFVCASPMMLSVSSIKMNWINKAGGFWQPNKYYGGFEIGMWGHLKAMNLDLVLLMDYRETDVRKSNHDDTYNQWKREHAHNGFKGNFDKYLEIIK